MNNNFSYDSVSIDKQTCTTPESVIHQVQNLLRKKEILCKGKTNNY